MIKVNEEDCEIKGTGEEIINNLGFIYRSLEKGDLLTDNESIFLFKLTRNIIIKNILKEGE